MKDKSFDCVEMMHQGGQKVAQEIKGMTLAQELECWKRKTLLLKEHQQMLREKKQSQSVGE